VTGVSLELCGGTHVDKTGEIALFRFTHETGSQAGVRRIEAITGPAAYRLARDLERRLGEASAALKTQPEHLTHRIETLIEENRKLERRVEELLRSGGGETKGSVEQIGDVVLHVDDSDLDDRGQIALTMDAFREKNRRAIRVLFSTGTRPGIHVAVTDDLVSQGLKAGDIAKHLAASTGGKGGGKPHFASGGVGDVSRLAATRAETAAYIKQLLSR